MNNISKIALTVNALFNLDYQVKVLKFINNNPSEAGNKAKKAYKRSVIQFIRWLDEGLLEPQLYLFSKIDDEIVNSYEEFLFINQNMEDTILYKYIEGLKTNLFLWYNFY